MNLSDALVKLAFQATRYTPMMGQPPPGAAQPADGQQDPAFNNAASEPYMSQYKPTPAPSPGPKNIAAPDSVKTNKPATQSQKPNSTTQAT